MSCTVVVTVVVGPQAKGKLCHHHRTQSHLPQPLEVCALVPYVPMGNLRGKPHGRDVTHRACPVCRLLLPLVLMVLISPHLQRAVRQGFYVGVLALWHRRTRGTMSVRLGSLERGTHVWWESLYYVRDYCFPLLIVPRMFIQDWNCGSELSPLAYKVQIAGLYHYVFLSVLRTTYTVGRSVWVLGSPDTVSWKARTLFPDRTLADRNFLHNLGKPSPHAPASRKSYLTHMQSPVHTPCE